MTKEQGVDTTSESLLVRVRDPEDQRAWREFEQRYADLIRRYCRRRGLERVDVDDVSQMVWGDLSCGLRNFSYDPAKGRFRGYLGRVVRSAISRHFSRNGIPFKGLDSGVLATSPDENDEEDTQWEKEWVDHHYRRAFATVKKTFEDRSVTIFTRLLAGESTDQIAQDYNMTVGAINQSKHRIRVRMQELIARQIREEDEPETFRQKKA